MSTLNELRIRVKSLKNTRKITSAMKMVSAAKLRRARDARQRAQLYIERMNSIAAKVAAAASSSESPLMQDHEGGDTLALLISSDRGLCGSFNNQLFKFFQKETRQWSGAFRVSVSGKRALDFVRRRGYSRQAYYQDAVASPSFQNAQTMARDVINAYLNRNFSRAVIFYNRFVSTLTQEPVRIQLLPFTWETGSQQGPNPDLFLFEPGAGVLARELIPKQIALRIFQGLLHNAAGEHGARMTAMDNATNNAGDLISSLTITMNRARQAAITKELIEIVSGAEALHK